MDPAAAVGSVSVAARFRAVAAGQFVAAKAKSETVVPLADVRRFVDVQLAAAAVAVLSTHDGQYEVNTFERHDLDAPPSEATTWPVEQQIEGAAARQAPSHRMLARFAMVEKWGLGHRRP